MLIVFVSGTGTDIGKTWYTAAVARILRARGFSVRAVKPAQSFSSGEGPTDAEILGDATGQEAHGVCPAHRWYPVAYAPPMAAAMLHRPAFRVSELACEIATATAPAPADVVFVEGAGGPRSPIAADGDNVDLARAVQAHGVVLVADAGLGTINAVLTNLAAFDASVPVVVALNRFDTSDELHRLNRAYLARAAVDTVIAPAGLADRLAARLSAERAAAGRGARVAAVENSDVNGFAGEGPP